MTCPDCADTEAERAEFAGYLRAIRSNFDACNYSELPARVAAAVADLAEANERAEKAEADHQIALRKYVDWKTRASRAREEALEEAAQTAHRHQNTDELEQYDTAEDAIRALKATPPPREGLKELTRLTEEYGGYEKEAQWTSCVKCGSDGHSTDHHSLSHDGPPPPVKQETET